MQLLPVGADAPALPSLLIRHPERVERLVLVSPVGIPRPPEGDRHANLSLPIRMLLGFFSKIWAWGVTPQDLVRGAGGWGFDLIKKYVDARFTGVWCTCCRMQQHMMCAV